ncbi:uncharacterized protein [Ptychodera flava]|uniref:uncharacterized protein n=1 Tax=Ptychodera flava TaxID=63121 RepID=UPI00396A5C0A
MTCKYGRSTCEHVEAFRTWSQQHEKEIPEDEHLDPPSSTFSYVSYKPIPYILPDDFKQKNDRQRSGKINIPSALIPTIPTSGAFAKCIHGCEWDGDDAVEHNWCLGEATLYFEAFQ